MGYKGKSDYYAPGEWNAICDVCGWKFKSSQLRERWDGFMVCKDDWETRHPQLDIRAVPDRMDLPWTRPEVQDEFVPEAWVREVHIHSGEGKDTSNVNSEVTGGPRTISFSITELTDLLIALQSGGGGGSGMEFVLVDPNTTGLILDDSSQAVPVGPFTTTPPGIVSGDKPQAMLIFVGTYAGGTYGIDLYLKGSTSIDNTLSLPDGIPFEAGSSFNPEHHIRTGADVDDGMGGTHQAGANSTLVYVPLDQNDPNITYTVYTQAASNTYIRMAVVGYFK